MIFNICSHTGSSSKSSRRLQVYCTQEEATTKLYAGLLMKERFALQNVALTIVLEKNAMHHYQNIAAY
jgi:hypothetical protein